MLGRLARLLDERGAVVPLVAVVLTVLVGFAAIVVDVGYLYENKRQLQSSADGAALAGAQVVIYGGGQAAALAEAESYAGKNDFPTHVSTPEELEMLTTPPETEVTDSYVQVTVENHPRVFLAGIFGLAPPVVRAQARAQVVYVTGADCLMPWGPVVIRADKVWASIGGLPDQELSWNESTERYEGSVRIPGAPSSTGYEVAVTTQNSEGFQERFTPEAFLVEQGASSEPITDVYFSPSDHVLSGGSVNLFVRSATQPKARFDGKNYTLNETFSGSGVWTKDLPVPTITQVAERFPVDVWTGSGATTYTINKAAALVVRRSTYPISDVDVTPAFVVAGARTEVNVSVEVTTFQYGEEYDLKVTSGAEAGNFAALDFRYVWHPCNDINITDCQPTSYTLNHGENDSAADYYDNIAGRSCGGEIHIKDIIETQTGNLSGPTTTKSLKELLGVTSSDELYTWSWYDAQTKPVIPTPKQIIIVPVVQKIERVTGKTDVIVESIAAFFLESIPDNQMNVKGRFIEYVVGGSYSDTPPAGLVYTKTVRLVAPSY